MHQIQRSGDLNTGNIWILNFLNLDFKWFGFQLVRLSCTRPTIQILDQYIRKQDGIHLSGIQMPRLSSKLALSARMSLRYYVKVVNGKVLFMSVKLYNENLSIKLVWDSIGPQLPGFQIWMTSDYWNMTLVIERSYQSFDSCLVFKPEWHLITGIWLL